LDSDELDRWTVEGNCKIIASCCVDLAEDASPARSNGRN